MNVYSCEICAEPAEITGCPDDYGDHCTPCHLLGCRACQDDLADQAAAESRFDGRWS